MKTGFLRAAAMAFLLGGTAFTATAVLVPQAAEAAVRPAVGNPLKAAIAAANAGHGAEALAKVHEAESAGSLTPAEQQAISQTKEYVSAKTGQGGGATACRTKFANDYSAGRYRDAIADADCLRKGGGLSGNDQLVVAQAYYLMGDYAATIRETRDMSSSQAQELRLSAAFKSGDGDTYRTVLQQLIRGGNTKYWNNVLTSAENAHGLKDHQTLDLLRLRFLTGNMRNKDDYTTAAELALQAGSPQEAANIVQKGLDTKTLSDDRAVRLLGLAKAQAAKDSAAFPAMQKAADASKSGDADVKLGEEYWGFARYADAVTAVQNGIAKGTADPANAQIRLGLALSGAGKKDAAISAFNKVPKTDANGTLIAGLWSLYASTQH
ncbi:MAG TPA: hypothetical protein VGG48_16945 [Rhizomicrobium sp.]|jgi:tetratricopeptide (TPR) repeat protein